LLKKPQADMRRHTSALSQEGQWSGSPSPMTRTSKSCSQLLQWYSYIGIADSSTVFSAAFRLFRPRHIEALANAYRNHRLAKINLQSGGTSGLQVAVPVLARSCPMRDT
jgi:hypothetical protein